MSPKIVLVSLALAATCGLGAPFQAARAAPKPPTISSFKPHSGAVGTTVVIHGNNFVPPLSIFFGGAAQASGSFSKTTINAIVPAGAASGPIEVKAAGGSVSTGKPFTVSSKRASTHTDPPLSVP
jgi:hypothetical protein